MSQIMDIVLDDAGLPPPTPEIEQERKVAMFDLLEENSFDLPNRDDRVVPEGPYRLKLAIRDKRLVFDVETEAAEKAAEDGRRNAENNQENTPEEKPGQPEPDKPDQPQPEAEKNG